MRFSLSFISLICALVSIPAIAYSDTILPPEQEVQAQELFHTLHCVVCSGQSLAGSDAKLARDMREHIRGRIAAGKSGDEITAELMQSYGDEILMEPPVRSGTLGIWMLPLLLLVIGGWIAYRQLVAPSAPAAQKED